MNKFYENTWFSILLIMTIVLSPVGIYLLAKNKKINIRSISAITGVIALTLLITGCSNKSTVVKANDNNSKIIEQQSTNQDNSKNVDNKDNTKNDTTTKESQVHFINTGNSDAILIKGEKNVLIDGGDNDDEGLVVNYIKQQGIKKIDYMIATHPHADHIGGLDAVIKSFDIGKLLVANGSAETKTYTDFIHAAANKNIPPSVPMENAKFDMSNGSYIQIFNSNGGANTNDESLVTLYVNGKDKFLFTGDAEADTENEILNKMVDVDVLKVGHHGSRSSTTESFLNKVNPEYAILTVGADNKYGHPHKSTMDKLKSKNIEVHRTDECGNIVFTSTGNGITTSCKKGDYSYRDGNSKKADSAPANSSNTKSSSNKTSQNVNSKNEVKENIAKPVETKNESANKKVWISETGKKYHSINHCGRMNPNKATQISLEEAEKSYTPCSKCF